MSYVAKSIAEAVTSPFILKGVSLGFRILAFGYFGGLFLFGLVLIFFNAMGWELLALAGYASLALIPHPWLRNSKLKFWAVFCISCYPLARFVWMMPWMRLDSGAYLGPFILGALVFFVGDLLIPLSLGASWLAWSYEKREASGK